MTNITPLIEEAIVELRSYMLQVYPCSELPINLLKVEELLLDMKNNAQRMKLPLITRVTDGKEVLHAIIEV